LESFDILKLQTQLLKAREQQQQGQQPQHQQQQQQQMQMQQLLLQRQQQQQQQQQQQPPQQQQQQQQQQQHQQQQQQQQQQRRDGAHLLNGAANGLVGNDPLMRQNTATANAMATKMYEEKLKLPMERDSLTDAAMKVGDWSFPHFTFSQV
jgi:hypothetical protein